MALIALGNIRCIDYLAYGSIFTRAMFRPKIKLDVFSRQKSRRCLPGGGGYRRKSRWVHFGMVDTKMYVFTVNK